MKILIWALSIFIFSLIQATFSINGIVLGVLPTLILLAACEIPAYKLCKVYDTKRYKKKYPNHTLEHLKAYIYDIKQDFLNSYNSSCSMIELSITSDFFEKASTNLSEKDQKEVFSYLLDSNQSPELYVLNFISNEAKLYQNTENNPNEKESKTICLNIQLCVNDLKLNKGYISSDEHSQESDRLKTGLENT